jgi:hypothetical protein
MLVVCCKRNAHGVVCVQETPTFAYYILEGWQADASSQLADHPTLNATECLLRCVAHATSGAYSVSKSCLLHARLSFSSANDAHLTGVVQRLAGATVDVRASTSL